MTKANHTPTPAPDRPLPEAPQQPEPATTAPEPAKGDTASPDVAIARHGLSAKLAYIAAQVGGIPKDKVNKEQGYRYRSEDIIMERLRALLSHEGISVTYNEEEFENLPTIERRTGPWQQVRVKVRYEFTDSETGEFATCSASGVGLDNGDKAVYKAHTGAAKYMLTKMFLISENGDPEGSPSGEDDDNTPATARGQNTTSQPAAPSAQARMKTQAPNKISEAECKSLRAIVDMATVFDPDIESKMLTALHIRSLGDMPANAFRAVRGRLEKIVSAGTPQSGMGDGGAS